MVSGPVTQTVGRSFGHTVRRKFCLCNSWRGGLTNNVINLADICQQPGLTTIQLFKIAQGTNRLPCVGGQFNDNEWGKPNWSTGSDRVDFVLFYPRRHLAILCSGHPKAGVCSWPAEARNFVQSLHFTMWAQHGQDFHSTIWTSFGIYKTIQSEELFSRRSFNSGNLVTQDVTPSW